MAAPKKDPKLKKVPVPYQIPQWQLDAIREKAKAEGTTPTEAIMDTIQLGLNFYHGRNLSV